MYLIDEILVSNDILEKKFLCALNFCKGACCWEGDFGAPVDSKEKELIQTIYPLIRPLLSQQSRERIEKVGLFGEHPDTQLPVTSIHDDGSCVFLIREKDQPARCGFEVAYDDDVTKFKKPISCHLYPIRVTENTTTGFEALNYDQWDICSAACTLGKKENMPLFRFVREAIIRKYGIDFYTHLEELYKSKTN